MAVFRYRLIADLANQPPGAAGIGKQLRAKAAQTDRLGGFDALLPKPRGDRGRPRRLPPQAAELLIALKTEHRPGRCGRSSRRPTAAANSPTACAWRAPPCTPAAARRQADEQAGS